MAFIVFNKLSCMYWNVTCWYHPWENWENNTELYFCVCDSNKDPQMRKAAGWECGVVGEVHALLCKEMEFGIDRRGKFCEWKEARTTLRPARVLVVGGGRCFHLALPPGSLSLVSKESLSWIRSVFLSSVSKAWILLCDCLGKALSSQRCLLSLLNVL